MYDVIRMADVARLVTAADGVPYVTPMHYQWQLDGCTSIFHFAGAAHGRRFDALCGNARAVSFKRGNASVWKDAKRGVKGGVYNGKGRKNRIRIGEIATTTRKCAPTTIGFCV